MQDDGRHYSGTNKKFEIERLFFLFCYSSTSSKEETDPFIDSQGSPPWLATTFNLSYELTQFAVYFQVKTKKTELFEFHLIFSIEKINNLIIHGLLSRLILHVRLICL